MAATLCNRPRRRNRSGSPGASGLNHVVLPFKSLEQTHFRMLHRAAALIP